MADSFSGANLEKLFGDAADELETDSSPGLLKFQYAIEELRTSFPNFELVRVLGCGGMGAGVFLARDKVTETEVALKVLPEDMAFDPRMADRFEMEAAAMRQLEHPHIVEMLEFGRSKDDHLYIVMEFVDGCTLGQLMKNEPLALPRILELFYQMCAGLEHAHDAGIIHRDIKPGNLLIDSQGQLKVSDFGLAKWYGTNQSMSHTSLGGTYGYISPEQLAEQPSVDRRSDIYSMGVVLYQMLSGSLPIGVYSAPSSRNPGASHLDSVVTKALQSDPNLRFHDVKAFRSAVEKQCSRAGSRRIWAIGSLIALVLVLIGGAWIIHTNAEARSWKRFEAIQERLSEPGSHQLQWESDEGRVVAFDLTLLETPVRSYNVRENSIVDTYLKEPMRLEEVLSLLEEFSHTAVFYWVVEELTIGLEGQGRVSLTNSPHLNAEQQELFLSACQLLDVLSDRNALSLTSSTPGRLATSMLGAGTFSDYCASADLVMLSNSRPQDFSDGRWLSEARLKIGAYELLRSADAASHPSHAMSTGERLAKLETWSFRSRAAIIAAGLCEPWLLSESSEQQASMMASVKSCLPALIERILGTSD